MIEAEELGLSSHNIDEQARSNNSAVRRFLGIGSDRGRAMGLTADWAARMVRFVGNYGEICDRNVGTGSKLGIPRGLNRLWNQGGIQYAPPPLRQASVLRPYGLCAKSFYS